jgi:DNA modification methylase
MSTTEHIAEDLRPLAQPINLLKLLPGNPRRGDVEAVMRSYDRFGQRKPIVARRDGTVIAGNHQLQAAQRLGWSHIAVVWTDDDDLTAKAFALADNRTADLGAYDDADLRALIESVAIDPELLAAASYSLDDLLVELEPKPAPSPEAPDAPTSAPAKTVRGDVWLLGPHRIMCGDCREPTDVETLLSDATINLAFTSPPYAQQRDYDQSSGFKPIPPDEYVEWFMMVQANVATHLASDGSWFVNIKAAADGLDRSLYVMDLVTAHVREWGWHFADEFCWERVGIPGQPARRFKNQWEPVYQFSRSEWKFRPEQVRHWSDAAVNLTGSQPNAAARQGTMGAVDGANFGEGLAYPGNRLPTFGGSHEATGHAAAFPVGLPEFFVKAYTDEGDAVYDPFMGSGSTLLAAHNQRRIGYGMEISPAYCDIICARWQKATGVKPIAESTGNEHDFLAGVE